MLQALYNLTTNYSPYSTNLVVSLQERLCISCYVGTEFLNITYFNFKPNFLKRVASIHINYKYRDFFRIISVLNVLKYGRIDPAKY